MEKMNGYSLDIVKENVAKLKEIFPEVFCEDKIDFERLQEVLGEYIDDTDERYRFEWHGKSQAVRMAQTPSRGTLRPCKEESKNWNTTQNLYIEGDNLEVLKLLQKSYQNKIKMIYIDPPYNTGNDFVYKDNYKDNLYNYLAITGQVDDDGNRTSTNSYYSGRFHTNWLNMMYPRLRLAKNLLMDDGVIFISIDDNEVSNLRILCDEVFGSSNFVAQITVLCNPKGRSQDKYFATNHEYIMIYSKSNLPKGYFSVEKEEDQINAEYPEIDDNGKYRLLELRNTHREFGKHNRPNLFYPIYINPLDKKISLNNVGGYIKIEPIWDDGFEGCWTWDKVKANKDIDLIKAKQINGGRWKIFRKSYANGAKKMLKTIFNDKLFFTEKGQGVFSELFCTKEKLFQSPKSVDLIKQLVSTVTDEKDIIFDFFAGSSTTAHAVMRMNAENKAKCKFIMAQLPESTNENSEAYKAGYKNICEIGKERIRRAGDKVVEENKGKEGIENLDIGFKVFKLDSSNIKPWNPEFEDIAYRLDEMKDNFVPNRTEEDVVYEIMLKYGIDLTYPIEEKEVNEKKVFSIGFGALIICLDDEITLDVVNGIVDFKNELNPEICRVVFKDNGFKKDSVKINAVEILKKNNINEVMSI